MSASAAAIRATVTWSMLMPAPTRPAGASVPPARPCGARSDGRPSGRHPRRGAGGFGPQRTDAPAIGAVVGMDWPDHLTPRPGQQVVGVPVPAGMLADQVTPAVAQAAPRVAAQAAAPVAELGWRPGGACWWRPERRPAGPCRLLGGVAHLSTNAATWTPLGPEPHARSGRKPARWLPHLVRAGPVLDQVVGRFHLEQPTGNGMPSDAWGRFARCSHLGPGSRGCRRGRVIGPRCQGGGVVHGAGVEEPVALDGIPGFVEGDHRSHRPGRREPAWPSRVPAIQSPHPGRRPTGDARTRRSWPSGLPESFVPRHTRRWSIRRPRFLSTRRPERLSHAVPVHSARCKIGR